MRFDSSLKVITESIIPRNALPHDRFVPVLEGSIAVKPKRNGGAMKRKLLVCKECGHEQRINIYDREESEKLNIRLGPPRCEKCGSTNVQLYD